MTEPQLILNVLACLMQKPSLLDESDNYLLEGYDFEKRQYEIIYSAIYNLYTSGVKSFGPQDIHLFLSNYEVQYKIFNEKVGLDVLMDATDFTDLSNWDFYYNRLKKYSALRRLKEASFPIGRFYHEGEILNFKKAQEAQERFDNATIEQIFDEILKEFFAIQDHYVSKSNNETFTAGHKLGALLEDLQRFPEIGLPLQGDIYNTICRGARRTKLYLDSGATGSGKSRRSAANAALLGYRHYYDWDKKKWIDSGFETKVQYITTEMTVDEIQTVMVAAISGIDEDVLLNGTYTMEQLKIKDQVVAYIESRDHVYIDHLPDYNIQQLKSRIRKLVTNNDVEYVFFDYIHTTPALMGEYSSFRLREDVILGMVSAALKDLCNELDVFIHTGTQLNAQWEGSKNRNQNLIRGRQKYCPNTIFPATAGVA